MKLLALVPMIVLGATAPALAQQPDLSELVTDTLGYVNIRPGVVLMEAENMGTFICKIDASDEAFDAYLANGSLDGDQFGYVCIPIEEFEN